MPPESQPSHRPTLEDLLRFKKAERPSPEFWAEFDRGLRRKQLAALVKQPKGWARVRPALWRGVRWAAVPATAAAAVALVVTQVSVSTVQQEAPLEVASRLVGGETLPSAPLAEAPASVVSHESAVQTAVTESEPGVAPAEMVSAPVVAVATLPDHAASWSTPSVEIPPVRTVETASVKTSHRNGQNRSSWSSRYNSLAREVLSSRPAEPLFQFASLDTSASSLGAQSAASSLLATSTLRNGRASADRDFRDLEARFGVSSSSLSFRF